jgi:protein TonB
MIMLNTLLESRAPRPRRMRSTMASALVHAALIAGAVALTMPGPVKATSAPERDPIYIIPPTPRPDRPLAPRRSAPPTGPTERLFPPTIAAPKFTPREIPPIEVGPARPLDDVVIGGPGVSGTSPIGSGSLIGNGGSVVDEMLVDRAPRLLGRAVEPSYPPSLREAGVQGRVVVQFVVDTLGRAELTDLQVIESPHPLFVDAVRAALARYRFSVGEAGGRKVRTRVQIPFEFTLTR